jgi:hypothetical protein
MTEPLYLLIKSLPLETLSSTGGSVQVEGDTTNLKFAGFNLVIENPAGTIREGVDETGKPWRTEFAHAYGEITGSLGVDGDPVDVYVGPDESAPEVYIVRQMKRKDWDVFDEDKIFLGFGSMEEAKQAYLNHYDDPRFFGGIIAMPIEEFRVKVRATKNDPQMIKALLISHKLIAPHVRKDGTVIARHIRGVKKQEPLLAAEPVAAAPIVHEVSTEPEPAIEQPVVAVEPIVETEPPAEVQLSEQTDQLMEEQIVHKIATPPKYAENIRALLVQDPQAYRNFGAYWFFIKEFLKKFYDQDQVPILGSYVDLAAVAAMPSHETVDAAITAAAEEYGRNTVIGSTDEKITVFDNDAGL